MAVEPTPKRIEIMKEAIPDLAKDRLDRQYERRGWRQTLHRGRAGGVETARRDRRAFRGARNQGFRWLGKFIEEVNS
jgi:hypothetical protein